MKKHILSLPGLLTIPVICHSYSTGDLRHGDIAGIWRLRSKQSFLPKFREVTYPMKEFTVFPIKKKKIKEERKDEDILLLLREDGNFVQYGDGATVAKNGKQNEVLGSKASMKGSWGLVDGKLILAAERAKDVTNIRSEAKTVDTMLTGQVQAISGEGLVDNPALLNQKDQVGDDNGGGDTSSKSDETKGDGNMLVKREDVHLKVSGEISVGRFFYPQDHPNFFEQPMFGPTPTGSFELQQVLGTLNTKTDTDHQPLEKFKKADLVNKKYFLTSYPLPQRTQKRQRWSIKYNKYVDDKPKSDAEKEREEREKNAPMPIKTFVVELFANNTFSSITGLGDTVLRGKWSIAGEERDQLWMSVWRFGFGRSVSGSTFSEGTNLSEQDDVSYWGKIYELDASDKEDSIDDDPLTWKGTKIEINGAVMLGVGLEPCSIARFTMIEMTEEDDDYCDDEDDDEYDDDHDLDNDDTMLGIEERDYDFDTDNFPSLDNDIGSFE